MSHWCRDIPRDEAVRASEDNRTGPLPTLEECIERVTERRPVDAGGGGNVTGLRAELVTHRFDAAIRQRDTLRAERITQALTADRFAAAVAEADSLKARVAELERLSRQRAAATLARVDELEHRGRESYSRGWNAAITREREAEKASKQQQATAETALESAPAASNSSEILTSSPAASGAAGTEPVAWAILRGGHFIVATVNEVAANESCKDYGGTVVPLYAAPQPAKGWLTEEQREAVAFAARKLRELANQQYRNGDEATATDTSREADFVDGILARSTPPEVVLEQERDWYDGSGRRVGAFDPAKTRAALAAAGVTAKEVGRE